MIIATKILVQEHRVIESVLLCLERLIERTENDKRLNRVVTENIILFLREFADACHHGKEEDVLFKFSDSKTGGHGPVEVLKDEHTEGRSYVAKMNQSCGNAANGDPTAVGVFCENARDLIDMLRRHIEREDDVVFPMIEELCQTKDADGLWEDFQIVEKNAGGDRHRRLIKLAKNLCQEFGIPFSEQSIPDLLTQFA
jgi:hemerythrin-like domain-containing protein